MLAEQQKIFNGIIDSLDEIQDNLENVAEKLDATTTGNIQLSPALIRANRMLFEITTQITKLQLYLKKETFKNHSEGSNVFLKVIFGLFSSKK